MLPFLGLGHILPVQRHILRTGHVPEKFVQNLCAGHSRQVPENLRKRCAGASKNVLRLCEICAGVHLHNSWRILPPPRMCMHNSISRNCSPKFAFFSETELYGQRLSQFWETETTENSPSPAFFHAKTVENYTKFSGNAEGSRNPGVIKFHGRLGC